MNYFIFFMQLFIAINSYANISLTCDVSGTDRFPNTPTLKINEKISVTVDEETYLTIEVQGSDITSTYVSSKDKSYKDKILKTQNLSSSNQWHLINEIKTKGKTYNYEVMLNRVTGLLHVNVSYHPSGVRSFSGRCNKSEGRKF